MALAIWLSGYLAEAAVGTGHLADGDTGHEQPIEHLSAEHIGKAFEATAFLDLAPYEDVLRHVPGTLVE